MGGLSKVCPGDPLIIPADTFNSFVDAAQDYQRRRNGNGGGPIDFGGVFYARISGRTQDGALRRWFYDWVQVYLTATGYVEVSGGLSGTYADRTHARNLCEWLNLPDKSGTQGNGVKENRSGFPANFQLQPIGGESGVSVIVRMEWAPEVQADETTIVRRAVFSVPNAEDGGC